MYTETKEFEWDHAKAERNKVKHGITFEEAITAFSDPWGRITHGPKHSHSEKRQKLLGATANGFMIIVIFTIRIGPKIRVISARPANFKERNIYDQLQDIPIS